MAALRWQGREGIYTAHESLESYRLTARGTILGGSKGVRYAYGGALRGGPDAWTQGLIERAFRDRFPELGAVKTVYLVLLSSHMLLAMLVVPLVLFAVVAALQERFQRHKRIVRFAWPIWMYVSVTGVDRFV